MEIPHTLAKYALLMECICILGALLYNVCVCLLLPPTRAQVQMCVYACAGRSVPAAAPFGDLLGPGVSVPLCITFPPWQRGEIG